jgi:hypothetical protein
MRKAKGKGKVKGKRTRVRVTTRNTGKAEKESTTQTLETVDFVQVRKNIAALVGGAAQDIAKRAIEVAKAGQLAPAKYLFEAVGLYPAATETLAGSEDSLAYTLLKRLGLPTDPLIQNEDTVPNLLANGLKQMTSAPAKAEGVENSKRTADSSGGEERALRQNRGKQDAVK